MSNGVTPRSYKGGSKKLVEELARRLENCRQGIERRSAPDIPGDPLNQRAASVGDHYDAAICLLWQGEQGEASEHLAAATEHALVCLNQAPEMDSLLALNLSDIARKGAVAASLAGQQDTARELFEATAQMAGGLPLGSAGPPDKLGLPLDNLVVFPLTRAYSLLRVGQLDGFEASLFTSPWPQAQKDGPRWLPATVEDLLDTAQICFDRAKAKRLQVFAAQKGLLPVLRCLAACLRNPHDDTLHLHAREALTAYFHMGTGLPDFLTACGVMHDLRAAYPAILEVE